MIPFEERTGLLYIYPTTISSILILPAAKFHTRSKPILSFKVPDQHSSTYVFSLFRCSFIVIILQLKNVIEIISQYHFPCCFFSHFLIQKHCYLPLVQLATLVNFNFTNSFNITKRNFADDGINKYKNHLHGW